MIEPWYAWTFAGVMALSLLAGGVALVVGRRRLPSLPIEHVAAAAIIGVAGWEILIDLPASIGQFFTIGAGIENAPITPIQVLIVANTAFAVASIVAVAGILQRTPWGIVLGVGVSVTRVTVGLLSFASLLTVSSGMPDEMLRSLAASSALRVVPSIASAVLLLLPFVRARRAPEPAATTGIGDVDPRPDPTLSTSSSHHRPERQSSSEA